MTSWALTSWLKADLSWVAEAADDFRGVHVPGSSTSGFLTNAEGRVLEGGKGV